MIGKGHEHPQVWLKPVILICEAVDALTQPAANAIEAIPDLLMIHNTRESSGIADYQPSEAQGVCRYLSHPLYTSDP